MAEPLDQTGQWGKLNKRLGLLMHSLYLGRGDIMTAALRINQNVHDDTSSRNAVNLIKQTQVLTVIKQQQGY